MRENEELREGKTDSTQTATGSGSVPRSESRAEADHCMPPTGPSSEGEDRSLEAQTELLLLLPTSFLFRGSPGIRIEREPIRGLQRSFLPSTSRASQTRTSNCVSKDPLLRQSKAGSAKDSSGRDFLLQTWARRTGRTSRYTTNWSRSRTSPARTGAANRSSFVNRASSTGRTLPRCRTREAASAAVRRSRSPGPCP